jgi:hypothetical protein
MIGVGVETDAHQKYKAPLWCVFLFEAVLYLTAH